MIAFLQRLNKVLIILTTLLGILFFFVGIDDRSVNPAALLTPVLYLITAHTFSYLFNIKLSYF